MGILMESSITEILIGVVLLEVFLLYLYFKNKFNYWEKRDVPYMSPTIPFGNLKNLILRKQTLGLAFYDVYNQFRRKNFKYGGFYMFAKPTFMPIDPELIKMIMTKDFGSFHDRGVYFDETNDPLSAHLFSIEGQKWRTLRTKLTPTFTSGKMKMMFHTLTNCGKQLEGVLKEMSEKNVPVDIKDIAARFTTDIISSTAFGLECNSLKNPDADFRKYGRKIFELSFFEGIKNMIGFTIPDFLRTFNVKVNKVDVEKFFMDVIRQTVDYRENNTVDRKDMMSLLLNLKNHGSVDDDGKDVEGISFNELAAQCFVFFVGGFETSSTTMTFALFELSQHRDIQDKLRDEIRTVLKKHNGEITYEAMMEMTYMDKVINETLRKYPPVPMLNRIANEDWRIPGSDTIIEKGTPIVICNYGMQMDPEYFPKPEVFDPERFSDENKSQRHPYCFIPFGEGPRNCIGMRFGMMQTKVGLSVFLKDHEFTLHPDTKLPIEYDVNSLILTHKYGIWLQTKKI